MTSIKDLETQIEGAEDALAFAKGELADLKTRLRELKEQEKPEQESLLGRWATHPKHGRGIIASDKLDGDGEVNFRYRWSGAETGVVVEYASLDDLTLDPTTLTTTQDFQDAPEGTIVEATTGHRDLYVKAGARWRMAVGTIASKGEYMMPCRVIRWGNWK